MKPEFVQFIGIGAGILTSVSMLPQIIKTFKEKSRRSFTCDDTCINEWYRVLDMVWHFKK